MARRPYPPSSSSSSSPLAAALAKANVPCVYRSEQRCVECHSRNLEYRALHLKYLRLDKSLVRKNGRHIVVLLGDAATISSEGVLAKLRNLFLYGILGAASYSEATLVDSGLATSWGVCQPAPSMEDYCRNVMHVGVTPGGVVEALSKWHSHQIIMNDFDSWDDRPRDAAWTKFALVRRVNGRRCRAVCVLANDGHAALDEAYAACAEGIPIVVMKGSGGLADDLAAALAIGNAPSSVFGDWTGRVQEMLASRCLC